ncbi:hypothetical protein L7F22_021583 [Adiantum nelumboides]|nr:hypothetical protein [Adiantum nelumboides]
MWFSAMLIVPWLHGLASQTKYGISIKWQIGKVLKYFKPLLSLSLSSGIMAPNKKVVAESSEYMLCMREYQTESDAQVGVNQGCPLSPTLLGLYTDEIVDSIQQGWRSRCGSFMRSVSSNVVEVIHAHNIGNQIETDALLYPNRLTTKYEENLEFLRLGSDSASNPSSNRTATLVNNYDCSLYFNVTAAPPFYVKAINSFYDVRTSKQAMNLVDCKSLDNSNKHENVDFLHDILLPSKGIIQLEIKFVPSNELLTRFNDRRFDSDLTITLLSKFEQRIPMMGILIFPKVESFSESIWFGTVLKTASQTLPFTIRNISKADAHWSLVQVQEEAAPSEATLFTNEEEIGSSKGPVFKEIASIKGSVFKFDIHEGVLKAASGNNTNEQLINVTFSPHEPALYKQRISIHVLQGQGCSLLLEGQGVSDIPPQAPPPVEPPPPKKPTKPKRLTR